MYNVPELLWFIPTAEHMEDPFMHLINEVPSAKRVLKNLWYSNYGDEEDRRVVVFNWKSLEDQWEFMGTPDYVNWCFPFIEMATGKTLVGQYQGKGLPTASTALESVFNGASTDFLYFDSERIVPLIRDYVTLLASCPDCVGTFWGKSVDRYNKFTVVLIVGWRTAEPQHDGTSGYIYCSLVNQARLQSLRHLTYVDV